MALKTHLVQGTTQWAKVIGPAPAGYDNGPPEWSFDLYINADQKKQLIASGMDKFYIKKNKEDNREFVRFVRKATRSDGTEAKPISIVDWNNNTWDTRLIGNGSTLNVCYTLNEVKSKGVKRLKPVVLSVQVWDLVQYKPNGPFKAKEVTPETDASGSVNQPETW